MRSIYMRNLIKSFFAKKKVILICWIVIVLICGGLGVLRAYPEKISSTVSEQVTEYDQTMQQYDDSIANTRESINMTEAQVEDLETYTNESVFMQIDPTDVQVISIQYMVNVSDMNSEAAADQITYILNAWQSYVSNGSLTTEMSAELGNITSEYLSELITSTTAGNIMTITVKHSDMDQARIIMQMLEDKIDGHRSILQSSLGNFDMTIIDSTEQTITDTTVQNTQNSNLSNLRNYRTTLNDLRTRLVNLQTQKSNYEEEYKPAAVNSSSPKRTILEYGVLGVIAGVVIPFVVWAVIYTLSSRLKSKEELLAAGLTVLATHSKKKKYSPDLSRVLMDVKLLTQQNNTECVCIGALGTSENLKQVQEDFVSGLNENEIDTLCILGGQETEEQLEKLVRAKNIILLAETGQTTCTQVEEQIQLCRRFGIDIWGCIVVE